MCACERERECECERERECECECVRVERLVDSRAEALPNLWPQSSSPMNPKST